jgi:hypothetical protein
MIHGLGERTIGQLNGRDIGQLNGRDIDIGASPTFSPRYEPFESIPHQITGKAGLSVSAGLVLP